MQLASASQRWAIPPPQAYTMTPMVPPPSTIPIVGITKSSLSVASVSSSGTKATALVSHEISPKCCCIVPTSVQPPESFPLPSSPPSPGPSDESALYATLIFPELAIPMEAQPEWINQPGGGMEYQCQLCAYQHTNKDCMLTHIRKHIDITIGFPMCSIGFQNVDSLCKHGKKVYAFQK